MRSNRSVEGLFSRYLYGTAQFIGWALSKLLLRAELIGRENVPEKGRAIFASNHRSYADPPLLGFMIPRPLFFVAKAELFRNRLFGWLIRSVHAFPVHRSGVDRDMLRSAMAILAEEKSLLLFPEGTRSKSDEFLPARPGIALLSEKSGAPVIPTYIHNSSRILPRGSLLIRPHKLYVCVGRPMQVPKPGRDETRTQVHAQFAEDVMSSIKSLRDDLLKRTG
ncbi:MAG: 1-acyl-sn-glycerol-3-phosphate acyltransferase [Candidatus Coatesbacteria bacterium]|nr:1-acyl-sn-glycerol-3-phosphate acyltransferase [Candidatus Coatesbacteria bacterium]